MRQFIQAPSGRQRFNVLGALHATSLQIVTVTNDTYINACSVAALLYKLAVDFQDLPITLVMDNARYQRCRLIQTLAAGLDMSMILKVGTKVLQHLSKQMPTEDEVEREADFFPGPEQGS